MQVTKNTIHFEDFCKWMQQVDSRKAALGEAEYNFPEHRTLTKHKLLEN